MPELGRLAGELGLAAGLLTRLPVGWLSPRGAPGRAVWAYPLVGAAIGAAGAATLWLGRALHLPPLLAASWALLVPTLLSGALHEDGLADTADGFGGGATRERKLAIMRDSRIGGFGAVALILAFALRGTALAVLPPAALVAAAMLGRAAMAGVLWALPPARADGLAAGLGAVPGGPALAALALAAAGAVLLLPPRAALAGLLAGAAATLAAIGLARRQIGGHTGDLCGATEQAVECVALTALAAVAG